jgi:PEP-CTERM motif
VNGLTFAGCTPACVAGIQDFDFTNGNAFFTGVSAQVGKFLISPFPTNGLSISTFQLLVQSDGGAVDLSSPAQITPEPSTVMVVGLGALVAMARYRRMKYRLKR